MFSVNLLVGMITYFKLLMSSLTVIGQEQCTIKRHITNITRYKMYLSVIKHLLLALANQIAFVTDFSVVFQIAGLVASVLNKAQA